jgi:hypothetical protein
MNILKFILTCFVFMILLNSCEDKKKNSSPYPPSSVFKLRGDYINNVCVGLSDDKSRITSFPSPVDPNGNPDMNPILLDSGYYWDCNYGVSFNDAFLSLTKTEWKRRVYEIGFPSKDSMMKLVLDPDPFLEYYVDENRVLNQKGTDQINGIIARNELGKYLKKLN